MEYWIVSDPGCVRTSNQDACIVEQLDKNTLLCVVRRFEISKLKNIIYETDKNAFVIVTDTKEVLGNGFKNY